jgi:hypothetical protein
MFQITSLRWHMGINSRYYTVPQVGLCFIGLLCGAGLAGSDWMQEGKNETFSVKYSETEDFLMPRI